MRSSTGARLFRHVTLRVILPEGHKPLKTVVRAANGRIFQEWQIDQLLEHAANNLEKQCPHWEFRPVPVGPNAFNFVYAGLREASPVADPPSEPPAIEDSQTLGSSCAV